MPGKHKAGSTTYFMLPSGAIFSFKCSHTRTHTHSHSLTHSPTHPLSQSFTLSLSRPFHRGGLQLRHPLSFSIANSVNKYIRQIFIGLTVKTSRSEDSRSVTLEKFSFVGTLSENCSSTSINFHCAYSIPLKNKALS
jgi:hypothetical protein